MSNVETLGSTYDEAFSHVSDSLSSLERAVNAALLTIYPNRKLLADTALEACQLLDSDSVEVNAIIQGKQITLVAQPGQPTRTIIRDRDSLCVLAVGADETLWIEDMKESEFLDGHSATAKWGAWVSSPIRIHDFPVGTVCALQDNARKWNLEDIEHLDTLARAVGDAVEAWAEETRKEEDE